MNKIPRRLGEAGAGGFPLLISLVIMGTLLRFWIAFYTREWTLASEYNAWRLLLKEAIHSEIHLDQLLCYPHEWGGTLLSAIALLLNRFQFCVPGLSISALLVDSFIRLSQVWIARRQFGPETALWFAVWTVSAVPSLLTWSFVPVTFHAFSSLFPFVLMWVAAAKPPPMGIPRWCLLGATLGLALVCSLSTLTLIPIVVAVAWGTSQPERPAVDVAKSTGVAIAILVPFILFGAWLNDGYAMERYNPFWNQVLNWEPLSIGSWWYRFRLSWSHSFPGSSVLPSFAGLTVGTTRLFWALVLYVGMALALFSRQSRREVWIGFGCLVTFMMAYPVNSFWLGVRDLDDHSAYLYYRHVPFVVPMVALMAIHGWLRVSRYKFAMVAIPVLMGALSAATTVLEHHEDHQVSYRAQGWVLGRKLGHDPTRLPQLLRLVPGEQRREFLIGYGWGLADAALLFSRLPGQESAPLLTGIVLQYPPGQRTIILEGVDYAFERTPGLDQGLRSRFHGALAR